MYTIIDLHTDPSLGDSSRANAVVNVPTGALIVGDVWVKPFDTNPHHAVLWDRNKGKMIDLQDPTWSWKPDPTIGPSSLALSVNQKGGVVGSTVRPLGDDPLGHGFYCKYDPTAGSASKMVDLPGIQPPALAAYTSFARGINEKGVIVGHVQIEGFLELLVDQAVWWREIMLVSQQYLPTTLTTLGTVNGPGSRAAAINKNGTIVGRCDIDKQGNFHACRWDWDMTTDEPTKTNPPVELFPAKHKVLKQISSNPATFAEVWESYAQSYA